MTPGTLHCTKFSNILSQVLTLSDCLSTNFNCLHYSISHYPITMATTQEA